VGFDDDGRAKSEDDVGRGGRDDALGIIVPLASEGMN